MGTGQGTGQIADRRDLCGSKALSSTVGYFHYLTCPQRGHHCEVRGTGQIADRRDLCGSKALSSTVAYCHYLTCPQRGHHCEREQMGTGQGTGQTADRRDLCGSKALSSTVGYFHYLTCPQRGPSCRGFSPTNRRRFTPIRPFAHTPLPSPRSTSDSRHSFRL